MTEPISEPLDAAGYLAAPRFERQLAGELGDVVERYGRLLIAPGPPRTTNWAQNIWLRPIRIPIRSVSDGARALRSMQRNWVLLSTGSHRRASLIQGELPHVSAKPIDFPHSPPRSPLGSWTLLDRDTILASPRCSSPFPNGEPRFIERKVGPPTRAYLKLWEALTILGAHPEPGDLCLDAGASPGGWTWALARLGARVIAVDRAPLHPDVASLPGVEYRKGSAFSVMPPRTEPFDWVFSDVVCYPERLWSWVRLWLEKSQCRNILCTIKFQGASHYEIVREFASAPGSRIVHLCSNKHELTWMLRR